MAPGIDPGLRALGVTVKGFDTGLTAIRARLPSAVLELILGFDWVF